MGEKTAGITYRLKPEDDTDNYYKNKADLKKENQTFLKCCAPNALTTLGGIAIGTTFTIASLNVNSSRLKEQVVCLEFASNITVTAGLAILDFQVFKQCSQQLIPVEASPVWTFARNAEASSGNAFSFHAYDCDSCNEKCCNYSVRVKVVNLVTVAGASINNVSFSAIVNGKCDNCTDVRRMYAE